MYSSKIHVKIITSSVAVFGGGVSKEVNEVIEVVRVGPSSGGISVRTFN